MLSRPEVYDETTYRTMVESLLRQLNQVGVRLQPFLGDFLHVLSQQCSEIVSAMIFLQGENATYQRVAAIGLPDVSVSPEPGSPAEQVLLQREPVQKKIENGLFAYGVPLTIGDDLIGVLQVNLPAEVPTVLQDVLSVVAVPLSLAIKHLQTASLTRASYEEALGQITSRLQEQTDLRSLLQQTMQDLGQVLGAKRARVLLQPISGPDGARE